MDINTYLIFDELGIIHFVNKPTSISTKIFYTPEIIAGIDLNNKTEVNNFLRSHTTPDEIHMTAIDNNKIVSHKEFAPEGNSLFNFSYDERNSIVLIEQFTNDRANHKHITKFNYNNDNSIKEIKINSTSILGERNSISHYFYESGKLIKCMHTDYEKSSIEYFYKNDILVYQKRSSSHGDAYYKYEFDNLGLLTSCKAYDDSSLSSNSLVEEEKFYYDDKNNWILKGMFDSCDNSLSSLKIREIQY